MYHFDVSWGESPDLATAKETPSEPYVGLPCGVKLSEADLKSMLTVRASAESGGQSLRKVGLQLDQVCAAEGASSAAEARAASALMVERMVDVSDGQRLMPTEGAGYGTKAVSSSEPG